MLVFFVFVPLRTVCCSIRAHFWSNPGTTTMSSLSTSSVTNFLLRLRAVHEIGSAAFPITGISGCAGSVFDEHIYPFWLIRHGRVLDRAFEALFGRVITTQTHAAQKHLPNRNTCCLRMGHQGVQKLKKFNTRVCTVISKNSV